MGERGERGERADPRVQASELRKAEGWWGCAQGAFHLWGCAPVGFAPMRLNADGAPRRWGSTLMELRADGAVCG